MPLVSVIIPTWNRKESLKRAIDSVLLQEGVSLEILVCDDGSTDGTVEMLLALPDPRIRFIAGSRGGRPAIPRNKGIKAASGEWLAFLDDDDEWLPGKLNTQLAFAKKKGYWAVTTNALRKIPKQEKSLPYHTVDIPECCDFKTLLSTNFVITSSVIVHSSLFKRSKGFPESKKLIVGEDYALWLRVSSMFPFGYINEPQILYTDIPSQSIRRFSEHGNKTQVRVYCNWIFWAKLGVLSNNGFMLLKELCSMLVPNKIYRIICCLLRKTKTS